MKNLYITLCLFLVALNINAQQIEKDTIQLKEVAVMSNGYQRLVKGQTTGSYVQLDSTLINRRVSPDILSRLADVTSGLIFNKSRTSGANDISIRGRSTLFGNDQPLVILDNFPYEGDLSAINPNDVESITVLKDAAAAAIWGARSGNGVIVITTRSGRYGQKTSVTFNTNFTWGARPDLFYNPRMSSADYIDMEKKLFASGFYRTKENSGNQDPLSPVVELLIAERDKKISSQEAAGRIEQLKAYDVRNDYRKYFYQNSQAQQYALQLSAGTAQHKSLFSAGYDRGLSNAVGNSTDRLSLRGSDAISFGNHKGEFSTEVYFIKSNTKTNPALSGMTIGNASIYPYARLADDDGNPLTIIHGYREAYVNAAPGKGLLDWSYNPLKELAMADQTSQTTDLRLNTRLKYMLLPGLTAEVLYQYTRSDAKTRNLQVLDSYYTRNLINLYTQVNTDGTLKRPIPLGGIQDLNLGLSTGSSLRGQLNYQRTLAKVHEVNVLAGYEIRSQETGSSTTRLYGFDSLNGTNLATDYLGTYKNYVSPSAAAMRIPFQDQETAFSDRYISWYGNAAYTFKQRYIFTGSARLDRSNIFGVATNKKGVPLYSAGLSWKLSDEGFYHLTALPYLKLRATFGYNGNVDKSLSAVTTAVFYSGTGTETNLPYAVVANAPNPRLRWERVKIYNLGLDFNLRKQVLYGSIDVYQKKGIDLIGTTNVPASSGISTFRGNTASTAGRGMDVVLNAANSIGAVKWNSSLLFSYVKDRVLKYDIKALTSSYLEEGDLDAYPYEGRPLSAIYSYHWAGLDPKTGDPQAYLNGNISKDYNAIIAGTKPENLVYNGPAKPPVFGAFRNTFEYARFSVSMNISYRLGYYFRRNSILYTGVLSGTGGHGDFSKRWQQPGDEAFTQVPSLPAVSNVNRDRIYTYSSELVEKADNVRFQDISLGYSLSRREVPAMPFSRLQLYAYGNNLGILWRANNKGIDPDSQVQKAPLTISVGFKAEF